MRHVIIVLLFIAGPFGPAEPAGAQDRVQYVCSPCGCRGDDVASDKPGSCATCGMDYVAVPVDFDDPDSVDVDAFLAATDTLVSRGPVLVHCAAAIKVASFWMVRRAVRDGWTYERAREEARRISLRRDGEWVEFAKKEIERRKGAGR